MSLYTRIPAYSFSQVGPQGNRRPKITRLAVTSAVASLPALPLPCTYISEISSSRLCSCFRPVNSFPLALSLLSLSLSQIIPFFSISHSTFNHFCHTVDFATNKLSVICHFIPLLLQDPGFSRGLSLSS